MAKPSQNTPESDQDGGSGGNEAALFVWGIMRKQNIQLQNEDGSHRQWLCQGEIDRLLESREVFRVTRRKDPNPKYRMKTYPKPSGAQNSRCEATLADAQKVAGTLRLSHDDEMADFERLVGLSLIPESAQLPRTGYLSRFTGACKRPLVVPVMVAG